MNAKFAFTVLLSVASVGTAHATLIDRGGGLIYDDVLDVTWMQDIQYISTTGQEADGKLNWPDAVAWASSLQYYDPVRGVIWSNWRLPSTINDPGSLGYDTSGLSSELAYMYYVNLGYQPNYEHDRWSPEPTSSNYNPFLNLAYRGYWSDPYLDFADRAWVFHFHFGSQETTSTGDQGYVWLVRDGDVSVPEPGTMTLFGLGLVGLGLARRRRAARNE